MVVFQNYRVGFDGEDVERKSWRGSGATILSTNEAEKQVVWGCLWTIHNDNLQTLDELVYTLPFDYNCVVV